ncbi:MAG: DUF507 family protein [Deltaproteobacteria bacterium]|nr:DUF507 family protein [Deltaproteobacteria bacterium]
MYNTKIPLVATEIVRTLSSEQSIAVTNSSEAELDVQAILKEYLRLDRELTDKAKDLVQQKGLPYEQYGRIKKVMAQEKKFAFGEEGLEWITNQIIEAFMNSPHIEEVFVEDNMLRRSMAQILRKHMQADDELDAEVRRRIKNLEEGSATWEIEYQKAMEQVKRNRGLE